MKLAPSLLAVALMAFAPVMTAGAAFADAKACPPGLAKKDPPCVPPGLAKKGVIAANAADRFAAGERLPDGYEVLIDPRLYEPGSNTRYVRYGDSIYRVDQDTGEVLNFIGLVSDFIN